MTTSAGSAPSAALLLAITPSRASIQLDAKRSGHELPDYVGKAPSTAQESREWTRMSGRMDAFHSRFRRSFKQLWEVADQYPATAAGDGVPLVHILRMGEELLQHLQMHHGIEEQYVFPVLAKRMPMFREEHLEEHEAIHSGLARLAAYLSSSRSKPSSYSCDEFRSVLTSFGPILFYHMNAEVESLKEDVLRRFYTLEEVRQLPM